MRPILFTLGPYTISSYPVMICLGACLAIWLTLREIDAVAYYLLDVLRPELLGG